MRQIVLIFLCAICNLVVYTQTPEQKKQMQEAKRKADSIMNLPHIKKMMKEVKAREAEFEKLEKERKAKEKPKSKIEKKVESETPKNSENEFYWRNTIASNTNGQFSNWSYGPALLRVGFYDRKRRDYIYIPFGTISENGRLNIELPYVDEQKLPFKSITTPYSEGDMVFYYNHLDFSNPDTEWVSTRFTLEVHQGDNVLGYLKMGNTIKPVVNLNSPCCTGKAGDGYAASWVYITDATRVNGEIDSKTGGKITHNLNLKQGWNFIKIEISGTTKSKQWKDKKHTALSSFPVDAKYFFIKK